MAVSTKENTIHALLCDKGIRIQRNIDKNSPNNDNNRISYIVSGCMCVVSKEASVWDYFESMGVSSYGIVWSWFYVWILLVLIVMRTIFDVDENGHFLQFSIRNFKNFEI